MLFQTTGILLRDLQIGIFRCFPVDPTSQLLAHQPSPSKASQPNRCKPYYLTYHVQYRSRSSIKMMCINELRPNTRSDSQTDRQTDRQAGRQTDRQRDGQRDRQRKGKRRKTETESRLRWIQPLRDRGGKPHQLMRPLHTRFISLTPRRVPRLISHPFGYHILLDIIPFRICSAPSCAGCGHLH